MTQTFDIRSIPLTASGSLTMSRDLLRGRQEDFTIDLADGPLVIKGKWLMVNIFVWRPLVKRGLPIERRHTLHEGLVTKEVLARIQTEIYNDVIAHQQGDILATDERWLLYDLVEIINDLHTMIYTQLGAYHLSVSAFELADLLANPEVVPLTQVNLDRELQISITAAEDKLKVAGDAMIAKMMDRTLPSNIIGPFLELGIINRNQLARVLVAAGFRTDASDMLIRFPITSSFVDGLKDIREFAVESLDAKKAIYYSRNGMPEAQYNSRKQQLLSSVIRRLYPGDCGSTLTVPYYIPKDSSRHVRGVLDKNIMVNGQMIRLTKENVDAYTNTTVQLRSPLTCRHTDGICHVCGGKLTDFMPPDTVVGIASSVEYMGQASSLVLSTKHYSLTKAIAYKIPEQLRDLLEVKQDNIYIRSEIDVSRLKLGIQFHDMPQIADIQHLEDDGPVGEQQFSNINYLTFATDHDTLLTGEVPMVSDTTVPYLSSEILGYIKDNFRHVEVGDMIWIPLRRFDHVNEPLLRCVIESSSMIKFNDELKRFMTSDIRNYISLVEVVRDFTQLVYRRIDTNLMHLEVVLKSYLIANDDDYNVPIVTDVDRVRFGSIATIIPRRSLGGQFAFERLAGVLADPATFNLGHKIGLFDSFFFPGDV
jgi:hypothetical protein